MVSCRHRRARAQRTPHANLLIKYNRAKQPDIERPCSCQFDFFRWMPSFSSSAKSRAMRERSRRPSALRRPSKTPIVERARGSAIAFRQQRRRLDVQGLADVDERAGGNTIGTLFRISESAENVTPISLASFSCETPSSRRLARTRAPIRRSASDAERASPLADLAIPTAAMSTQRYIGEAPETEPKVERSGARIEFQPRSAPSARVRTSSTTR